MSHQGTELITPEEAIERGELVTRGPVTVLSLAKDFHLPHSVHGSNMRSAWRQESRGKGVFVCQGIVFHHPLERGDAFVLVESIATVLGFYNGEPGVLCAAYGKPVLLKAWNVTVGPMLSSSVAMANVAYFDTVVLYIQSEHTPK